MGIGINMLVQKLSGKRWVDVPGEGADEYRPWGYYVYEALVGPRKWLKDKCPPFPGIDNPRGFPEGFLYKGKAVPKDLNNLPEESPYIDFGDCNYSWVLLSEVLAYDWHRMVEEHRTRHDFAKDANGRTVEIIEWGGKRRELRFYCSDFLEDVARWGELSPDASKIRLVFGFD